MGFDLETPYNRLPIIAGYAFNSLFNGFAFETIYTNVSTCAIFYRIQEKWEARAAGFIYTLSPERLQYSKVTLKDP